MSAEPGTERCASLPQRAAASASASAKIAFTVSSYGEPAGLGSARCLLAPGARVQGEVLVLVLAHVHAQQRRTSSRGPGQSIVVSGHESSRVAMGRAAWRSLSWPGGVNATPGRARKRGLGRRFGGGRNGCVADARVHPGRVLRAPYPGSLLALNKAEAIATPRPGEAAAVPDT